MPKTIKKVQEVVARAMKNGESKSHPYEGSYNGSVFTLYHYGTPILMFDPSDNRIIETGGWSNSDRDAIYSALAHFGYNAWVTGSERVAKKEGFEQMGSFHIKRY